MPSTRATAKPARWSHSWSQAGWCTSVGQTVLASRCHQLQARLAPNFAKCPCPYFTEGKLRLAGIETSPRPRRGVGVEPAAQPKGFIWQGKSCGDSQYAVCKWPLPRAPEAGLGRACFHHLAEGLQPQVGGAMLMREGPLWGGHTPTGCATGWSRRPPPQAFRSWRRVHSPPLRLSRSFLREKLSKCHVLQPSGDRSCVTPERRSGVSSGWGRGRVPLLSLPWASSWLVASQEMPLPRGLPTCLPRGGLHRQPCCAPPSIPGARLRRGSGLPC